MLSELLQTSVEITPGEPVEVEIDVFNNSPVIDGVGASIVGLNGARVDCEPAQAALFPDGSARLVLRISLPRTFPAGPRAVEAVVTSAAEHSVVNRHDLTLVVAPAPAAVATLAPAVRSGHRKGSFLLLLENTGNTGVDLALGASDAGRTLSFAFDEPRVSLAPGEARTVHLGVRAGRLLTGSDLAKPFVVVASDGPLEVECRATYRQRPTFPRGPLTALVLAAIVGAWAFAFFVGIGKVLGGDAFTKAVPASFFAAAPFRAGQPPSGVASKTGNAPAGTGGTVTGTVKAASTGRGIGRIAVEVIRERAVGGAVLVSSAATGADGTYAVPGLLPGRYKLRFSAKGFATTWFPGVSDEAAAGTIAVHAAAETADQNVHIVGDPVTITGQVDAGLAPGATPVTVSVAAQVVIDGVPQGPTVDTTMDAPGAFVVPGLPSPATYRLTFTALNYLPTVVTEEVLGGQPRTTNTIRLSAGPGSITGLVTDDGLAGLGGVAVTAASNIATLATVTPTAGQVGTFTLSNLPTPGTYLLTFTKDGFGQQTVAVDLGPGEQRPRVDVNLVGGTGTIRGRVADPGGQGLGDVTIAVLGAPDSVATKSLTTRDAPGTYLVTGLPTPGRYTLTFSLTGYTSQTVAVTLASSGSASGIDVILAPSLGCVGGHITGSDPGNPALASVAVTLTDGAHVHKTKTASAGSGGGQVCGATGPGGAGAYLLTDLPAGVYSVTYDLAGYASQTASVTIVAGHLTIRDMVLQKVGG